MQPLPRPEIELIFGRGGTGKTRLALSRIGPRPVILFDVNGQPALIRHAVVATTKRELIAALDAGERRITWRGFLTMGADAFEFANRAAWAYGDRAVFWDEADRMMPVHPVPPWAYALVNAGRHRGCTIFATARRPAAISRHLTANATAVHSYTVTGRRDLVYLAEFFDEAAADLPQLGRGEALAWTDTGGTTRKKIY